MFFKSNHKKNKQITMSGGKHMTRMHSKILAISTLVLLVFSFVLTGLMSIGNSKNVVYADDISLYITDEEDFNEYYGLNQVFTGYDKIVFKCKEGKTIWYSIDDYESSAGITSEGSVDINYSTRYKVTSRDVNGSNVTYHIVTVTLYNKKIELAANLKVGQNSENIKNSITNLDPGITVQGVSITKKSVDNSLSDEDYLGSIPETGGYYLQIGLYLSDGFSCDTIYSGNYFNQIFINGSECRIKWMCMSVNITSNSIEYQKLSGAAKPYLFIEFSLGGHICTLDGNPYYSIQAAFNDATDDSTIKMCYANSYDINNQLVLSGNKQVTLIGKITQDPVFGKLCTTIVGKGGKNGLKIVDGATLIIQDLIIDGDGNSYCSENNIGEYGTGGFIQAYQETSGMGGGHLVLNSGAVVKNATLEAAINENVLTDYRNVHAIIAFNDGSSLTMNEGSTITKIDGHRSVLRFESGSVFTMNGGTIDDCHVKESDGSEGVVVYLGSGKNGNNDTTNPSTFIMNGGTILNCSPDSSLLGNAKGVIFMHPACACKVELNGGTIKQCLASYGGAVYSNPNTGVTHSLLVSGTFNAIDNWGTILGDSIKSNLYFGNGSKFIITEELSGAQIGVLTETMPTEGNDIKIAEYSSEIGAYQGSYLDAACIISDLPGHAGVIYCAGEKDYNAEGEEVTTSHVHSKGLWLSCSASVIHSHGGVVFETAISTEYALEYLLKTGGSGYLVNNIVCENEKTINSINNMDLCLNGYSVTTSSAVVFNNSASASIYAVEGGSFNIKSSTNYNYLFNVTNSSTLNIYGGQYKYIGDGTRIFSYNAGTSHLNISNAIISDFYRCKVESKGALTIIDSSVCDIYIVEDGSRLYIEGNVQINDVSTSAGTNDQNKIYILGNGLDDDARINISNMEGKIIETDESYKSNFYSNSSRVIVYKEGAIYCLPLTITTQPQESNSYTVTPSVSEVNYQWGYMDAALVDFSESMIETDFPDHIYGQIENNDISSLDTVILIILKNSSSIYDGTIIYFKCTEEISSAYEILGTLTHDGENYTYVMTEYDGMLGIYLAGASEFTITDVKIDSMDFMSLDGDAFKSNKLDVNSLTASGEYACKVISKTNSNAYVISDCVSIHVHTYGTPTYTWNNDKCTATRVCTADSTHVDSEEVTGTYVKDTDATCTVNENGHYVATFTNTAFTTQTTAANSVEKANTALGHDYSTEWTIDTQATCSTKGSKSHHCTHTGCTEKSDVTETPISDHTYGTPTYIWNNDKCTATRVCTADSTHVDSEEVTGTYVKDTDATCTVNEKGHYVATFTNTAFTTQTTAANSVEKANTALGHDLVSIAKQDATCTATGHEAGHNCSRCDYKDGQASIAPLGHTYGDWTIIEEATTTSNAKRKKECSRCHDAIVEQVENTKKNAEIIPQTTTDVTSPEVTVTTPTGFEPDVKVIVEVTVETEVETKINANTLHNYKTDLAKDEVVGVVFDVKLKRTVNGVETEIQPTDLDGVTSITVLMKLPEGLDLTKVTRILHVHGDGTIDEYEFDSSKVKDGYYEITISKLSEFAFIYKNEGLSVGAIVAIVVCSLLLLVLIIYLLGYFFCYRRGHLDDSSLRVIYLFLPRGNKNKE